MTFVCHFNCVRDLPLIFLKQSCVLSQNIYIRRRLAAELHTHFTSYSANVIWDFLLFSHVFEIFMYLIYLLYYPFGLEMEPLGRVWPH